MHEYCIERWTMDSVPDAGMLRQRLSDEGFSVYQWTDQPGSVYGEHQHAEDQSHWVISGQIELSVRNAGTFVLRAGDRDLMPAGTYHSARVVGEQPVVYLIGSRR